MKDLVIIGGGPGGYVAAIRAAQLGMNVCLIEKNSLGGVCLNEGCIPTKTLLKSASILEQINKSDKFGITVKEATIDIEKVIKRKNDIVKQLVNGVSRLLKKNNVEVIKGTALVNNKNMVLVNDGEIVIETKSIIIASGSIKVVPPIKGIELDNVMFSEEALNFKEIPSSIAIIGGGVIGLEFATYYNAIGSEVIVIEAMESLLPNMDREISKKLEKKLKKRDIKIHTNTFVKEITENGVIITVDNDETFVESQYVLVAIGRQPYARETVSSDLNLEFDRKAIKTNNRLETNIPNIYCIGDANGKSMLAHTAMKEGIIAVENIAGEKKIIKYENIPAVVFTSPEIASLGFTEEKCKEQKIKYKIGKFPYKGNGKALSEGEEGLIKTIVDYEFGEILGVHIIGNHGADLIMEGTIAKANELTVDEIINTVHPHPSISEVFEESILDSIDKSLHS